MLDLLRDPDRDVQAATTEAMANALGQGVRLFKHRLRSLQIRHVSDLSRWVRSPLSKEMRIEPIILE